MIGGGIFEKECFDNNLLKSSSEKKTNNASQVVTCGEASLESVDSGLLKSRSPEVGWVRS